MCTILEREKSIGNGNVLINNREASHPSNIMDRQLLNSVLRPEQKERFFKAVAMTSYISWYFRFFITDDLIFIRYELLEVSLSLSVASFH